MLVLYTYDPEAIVFGGSIAHAFGFSVKRCTNS